MDIINQEILDTLERLSRLNVDFLEFIKRNPEGLRRSSYDNLTKFNIGPRNIQPWPTFISPQTKNQFQEASSAVYHLIKQIPMRLFDYNPKKISNYYGVREDQIQIILEDAKNGHLENLLARGDFIFSSRGLKCLEYNITAYLGGWQQPILESAYLNNPFIAKFLQEYQVKIYNKSHYTILLKHLLTIAKKKFYGDKHGEINIGIAIRDHQNSKEDKVVEVELNRAYQQVLKEQGNHFQGKVFLFDLPDLTIENDCIFFKGQRIHAMVELYHGNIPPQIFYVSLLGNLLIYNGPITLLLSNKLNLVLLSENEETGVFNQEEREIIKKYVPWTRRVVPGKITFGTKTFDIEDFLNSHREKLVIKPVFELGGVGVQVGKFTPVEQWEEAIKSALRGKDGNWLVQEYIEPLPHVYQYGDNGYVEHLVVWGLFVFGSTYAGGYIRLMPGDKKCKGVINSYQGAERTVILEVDE